MRLRQTRISMIAGLLFAALMLGTAAHGQELSRGQTVYIPIYSSVVFGEPNDKGEAPAIPFSNILSIRNTDAANAINVRSVKYYNTEGKLLREESEAEHTLAPLASANVFVSSKDTSGGNGGSFVVKWEAKSPVNTPIIEGLNIFSLGQKMGTFVSRGKPIQDAPAAK